ncbi:MAG: PIN domain nuclease [Epsilonproteobacteria bacterium]|nr:MAG: PIN domain nuclease [Campylobacterota bacterium]
MAKYLLDTHIFLWWLSDADKLERKVFDIISDTSNKIYVSSASIWEIAIKEALGKLEVNADLDSAIEANGFIELKISAICANATKKLEQIHRDPFDRILIAQAINGDMTLITVDGYIVQYKSVKVLI